LLAVINIVLDINPILAYSSALLPQLTLIILLAIGHYLPKRHH